MTWRLFDYEGGQLTYGGLQRWLLALIEQLDHLGCDVHVHQKANHGFQKKLAPHATVFGHRTPLSSLATPWFNYAVHRSIPDDAPVVYMAEDVSFPICRARSLVVQHGVWWDGEYGALKLRAAEHMVREAVKQCAGVVCVDTNFINWYRSRWPSANHDQKLHFVPNFVDPAVFGPAPETPAAARTDDRLTICFPRRSEPRRGTMLMADVVPTILAKYDHVDFRFTVGSGNHTEELRRRLQSAGCPEDRYRIESVPLDAMRTTYAGSSIVTIPTLCGEGTSLSAIEAMYFGCAIVATWVGGLTNLLQHEHNGLLIAPDRRELTNALCRLIEDHDLRHRLGREAMRSVVPQFGIDRWRARMHELLPEVLELPTGVST